ncbi:DoxX family protein [Pedobacter sp. AW1-32]|uniref:DoxX family protein n=1 Tax=Pedobacter sp. AW1-32 TaxID=3383026 RepID=UPI003FED7E25
MIKKILLAEPQNDYLVLVRVIVGLWIMWYGKDVLVPEWYALRLEQWGPSGLGFSNPAFMLYLSKGSEMLFGFLLTIGLFTRFASLVLLFVMSVAVGLGQGWAIFPYDKGEITFFYWLFFIVFLLVGGGKYSFDNLIFKKKN